MEVFSCGAVWDTFTLAAAEMSEEVKDKATGKSAHRKKKGKKECKWTLQRGEGGGEKRPEK
ncbi:hypothetical protein F7725_014582 [Dissostichus mawsoni]|uniref:Uncharacterized protein n=1 Tax=Dissostichus mawsoni TaxID=36200 RepID=A0A7J5YWB3_DISMA|nr:hypothetical protein F7725_014582 [Dissostichus mawsoni]